MCESYAAFHCRSSPAEMLESGVTTVQRINTVGGRHDGTCDKAGALHSAPYAADYVFLKK